MREVAFLKQNAEKWKQFEALLRQERRADPDRLAELFVEITDDLSYARTFFPKSRTTHYLNDLAAEIHQAIYKNKREDRRRFAMFWRVEVPLTVRAAHRALLVSLVIFVIAMGIGVISTLNDDGFARLILGDAYVNMTLDNIERHVDIRCCPYLTKSPIPRCAATAIKKLRVIFYA